MISVCRPSSGADANIDWGLEVGVVTGEYVLGRKDFRERDTSEYLIFLQEFTLILRLTFSFSTGGHLHIIIAEAGELLVCVSA